VQGGYQVTQNTFLSQSKPRRDLRNQLSGGRTSCSGGVSCQAESKKQRVVLGEANGRTILVPDFKPSTQGRIFKGAVAQIPPHIVLVLVLVLERVVPGVRRVHRSELLGQIGHDSPFARG
jgi:hypothetical protein